MDFPPFPPLTTDTITQDPGLQHPELCPETYSQKSEPVIEPTAPNEKPRADYSQLENFLKTGEWREADQETARILLELADRQETGWLLDRNIKDLPCTDLRTLDRLWVKYSQDLFGFSVQQLIWINVGGQPNRFNSTVFRKFGNRVGWRVNSDWLKNHDDLTFTLEAPKGHLPSLRFPGADQQLGWFGLWQGSFRGFLSRMNDCVGNAPMPS